jgi:hypothetical protein
MHREHAQGRHARRDEDVETRFPKPWHDWLRNELYAITVLKNRTNWIGGLLEEGADVAGLDHCGDTCMCDACHSSQEDAQVLNIIRAKGLKLNDLGPH